MENSLKEKIKEKISIDEVIEIYGIEVGENNKCPCPFHEENTPSFHVYRETNTFNCYGCHQQGDIFDFVMLMDGVDFLHAFNKLANIAGISAHENNNSEIPLEDLLIKVNSDLNIIDLAIKLGLEPDQSNSIPSFYSTEGKMIKLFPEENLFCCPSPGHSGNVIQFYSDYKRISIQESALELYKMFENKEITLSKYKNRFFNAGKFELVADEEARFNVALNKYIIDDKLDEKIARQLATDIILARRKLLSIYYFTNLHEYCIGPDDETMEYLTGPKRGLTKETIDYFKIFSIPDYNSTGEYLRNLKHPTIDYLRIVGLFNENERLVLYKHKIIIPFFENNNIAYLRGRYFYNSSDIPPQGSDKYLGVSNSSGILSAKRFFNKDILLNTPEGENILICEGEFDTMIAHQNGYKAIGILGVNNFPGNQIALLNKYKIYICLDNDKSGAEASNKIASLFGHQVKIIKLKMHKDLTELFTNVKINLFENSEYVELIEFNKFDYLKEGKFISAAQLLDLELPPINWIIPNFISEGLTLITGKPREGKSLMALDIAISVAKGQKVFDYFETNKHSVLFISFEDPKRRIKDRTFRLLLSSITEERLENLFITTEFPRLNSGGLELIEKIINENHEIKLIVIDPLALTFKSERSVSRDTFKDQYEILNKLQKFANEYHLSILLVHHQRKSGSDDQIDKVLGSTAIAAASDNTIILEKKKLHIRSKDLENKEYDMEFDNDLLKWIIKNDSSSQFTPERQEIINLFNGDYNLELSTGEIAARTGKSEANVSQLIRKLVRDEILERMRYGFYKLKNIDS